MKRCFSFKLLYASALALLLVGCAATPPAEPQSLLGQTKITVSFHSEPTPFWRERIERNAVIAGKIITSEAFAERLRNVKLTRTNGRTSAEVCRHLQFSGPVNVVFGFYHDTRTSAIAYEGEGAVFINTAREDAAGLPGNIAHELTHQLGYTHLTNFRIFGRTSVPYVVGDLVHDLNQTNPAESLENR
jgi:hypothetical protein